MDGTGPPPAPQRPSSAAVSMAGALERRVMVGALVGVALGALDGALAWLPTPRAELGLRDLAPLVGFSASMVGAAALLVAVVHTVVARAAVARGALREASAYLAAGPRRWFQRDERAALRVVMLVVGAGSAAALGFRLALLVVWG